jgi:hypothetical protein
MTKKQWHKPKLTAIIMISPGDRSRIHNLSKHFLTAILVIRNKLQQLTRLKNDGNGR